MLHCCTGVQRKIGVIENGDTIVSFVRPILRKVGNLCL